MTLLEVKNLEVRFPLRQGELIALNNVSFSLNRGERLGIVGESGAGKSVAAFSILNLIGKPGYIAAGEVRFEGRDLAKCSEREMQQIRGNRISMIFQDPMMTLNPVLTIGAQMIECLHAHQQISVAEAREIALEKLRQVHIPSPEARLQQYPHELSGGMRQRVVIAIALLSQPAVIIADEPTTALDVTIQAEIMSLLLELCDKEHLALILITHDLGVVAQTTQRTIVMYAGQVVEQGSANEVLQFPLHPYTSKLVECVPKLGDPDKAQVEIPGLPPAVDDLPVGCFFAPRCHFAADECTLGPIDLNLLDGGRSARCLKVSETG